MAEPAALAAGRGEAGRLGGDGEVAGGDQLAAGGGGQRVHPGEHHLRDGLDGLHQLGAQQQQAAHLGQRGAGDVGEVVAGAEHRPLAGEHDPRRVALARLGERGQQLGRCSRDSALRRFARGHRDADGVAVALDPGGALTAHDADASPRRGGHEHDRRMEPVRFGLVGYGFGGRWFHAPLLAAAPECDLLGRGDVVPRAPGADRAGAPGRRAVRLAGGPRGGRRRGGGDLHSGGHHTELTDQALGLGLAVVCDKPFALDAAAARGSVELAERLGLPLAPYQNRRWDSDFRTVRALVERGALGTVTRFESRFERFDPEPGPPAAGGGTLLDFGSHLVDQALVLLGPVESVYAEFRVRESGLDDDVFVALTHANGARSHLWGSWSQGAPGSRFRVTGHRGRLRGRRADGRPGGGPARRADAGDRGRALGRGAARSGGARLARGGEGEPVPTERGRWDTFYPAFAAAVRGEGAVPVDPRDAVATATVLDAARRSATDGVVVTAC